MLIAITREISPAMQDCELTHLARTPIDLKRAQEQHYAYEQALSALGCRVERLPAEPGLPDSVFVEDAAIVLDELAIITRPGALSRRPETETVSRALEPYRAQIMIQAPGTVDGGDVLLIGKRMFIGISGRSNREAVEQVRVALAPLGYEVIGVPVHGCLHLKSAVTQVGANTLLVNPAWIELAPFEGYQLIEIDPQEPHAANGLLVNGSLIYPAAYMATRKILEEAGVNVVPVDVSEIAKAEGAVTCCSLVFESLDKRKTLV